MRKLISILLLFFGLSLSAQYTIVNPYEGVDFGVRNKGNLHMHTIESDGSQSVFDRIIGGGAGTPYGYATMGYRILAITDHDSYENDPYLGELTFDAATTWPWHRYSGMEGYSPSAIYIHHVDTSSMYYPDIGSGVLAVRGNELTECQTITGANGYFTHINSFFSNLGWDDCPVYGGDSLEAYLHAVDSVQGMAVFNHPGRHTAPASFYNKYFTDYYQTAIGIEIHNAGDYRPIQNPRVLWDQINAMRPADSLIWGFSNTDIHQGSYDDTTDIRKNFNLFYVDTLTETALRANLLQGGFTAHWSAIFNDFVPGQATHPQAGVTPTLTGVTINGTVITLTATNCDSVRWFDNTHDSIETDVSTFSIDVADYPTTNFVRAELYYDDGVYEPGITYTQPFGVAAESSVYGGDYFVSPSGSDSEDGSFDTPWASMQKAIETAVAGDTVWFLDGTYTPTSRGAWGTSDVYYWSPDDSYGNSGEEGNPISFLEYPGADAIIDYSEMDTIGGYITGLYMDNVHHVVIKGLTFQNLPKGAPGPNVHTIDAHACSNFTFEELVLQNNGGPGIRYFSGIGEDLGILTDSTYVINCDFFNNADSSGNHADALKFDQDKGAYFYFYGNRAMFNTDDGFDISGSALRVFVNNWAFGNGWVPNGNGQGFKCTGPRDTVDYTTQIYIGNLSAYNRSIDDDGGAGFGTPDYQVSDTSYRRANARFYNNTSYHNDINFIEFANPLWDFRNNVYRNNIAYAAMYEQDGQDINVQILTYEYPESHNTWDWESGGYSFVMTDTVTVTDDDFVLTDSTLAVAEMLADRKADGSLPDITFMTLVEGSDLIDAGTTYGYDEIADVPGVPAQTIYGDAPDIGAFEWSPAVPTTPVKKIYTIGGVKQIYWIDSTPYIITVNE